MGWVAASVPGGIQVGGGDMGFGGDSGVGDTQVSGEVPSCLGLETSG